MSDDRVIVTAETVRALVAEQFPQWADLPVAPMIPGGWNNRTFRLGDAMLVRLPSAPRYVAQVEKEQTFLPRLAAHLPLPIPVPLAMGAPGHGYEWPFGIYGWIDGTTAHHDDIADLDRFAADLAGFITALEAIDATGGPVAGPHNFHRGGDLSVYDGETRAAFDTLGSRVDRAVLEPIWDLAVTSDWGDTPVWIHGDIAFGNLLVRDGRLAAVIDFGTMGVGDPACDLAIAWTFLARRSRAVFRNALPFDAGTWQRGRGWTLWKALITLAQQPDDGSIVAREQLRVIAEILDDHQRDAG